MRRPGIAIVYLSAMACYFPEKFRSTNNSRILKIANDKRSIMEQTGFFPKVDTESVTANIAADNAEAAFDLLVQPLHEELYRRQTFDFLDELTPGQRVLITFDYVRGQVAHGGFIQLIQNGYTPLLVPLIEGLQAINTGLSLVPVFDDVLKVFVLNKEALSRETTVEEFGRLYAEFKEFDALDSAFTAQSPGVVSELVTYVLQHPAQFLLLTLTRSEAEARQARPPGNQKSEIKNQY